MEIKRKELIELLNKVKPAVSTRDFQPILKSFLFDGDSVVGYNGELVIMTPFKFFRDIAIPGDTFFQFLSLSPKDEIKGELKDGVIELRAGRTRVKIPIQTFSDLIPQPEDTWTMLPLPKEFFTALKILVQFMGKDETQPAYRGIYIKWNKLFATDGFRLACYSLPETLMIENILMPESFCHQLIDYEPEELGIGTNKSLVFSILRENEAVHVRSSIIEADYPDLESVFVELPNTTEPIPITPEFIEILPRVNVFTTDLTDKICHLSIKGEEMNLVIENPKTGNIVENLTVPIPSHANVTVSTNFDYLQSILKNCDNIEILQENHIIRGTKGNFKVVLVTLEE